MTKQPKTLRPRATGRLMIDRRAEKLVQENENVGLDPEEHLSAVQVANWFGVSAAWLEVQRSRNAGPPFVMLSPAMLRYRRGSVLAWLKEREFQYSGQYTGEKRRRRPWEERQQQEGAK